MVTGDSEHFLQHLPLAHHGNHGPVHGQIYFVLLLFLHTVVDHKYLTGIPIVCEEYASDRQMPSGSDTVS